MRILEVTLPNFSVQSDDAYSLIRAAESRMLSLIRSTSTPSNDVESAAQQAASYHLGTGGRRIRAHLAVHVGLALDLPVGDIVSIAATAELTHNASLIHDDLQDRDRIRRGVETVWLTYGDGVAICAGDLLLSAAYCALAGVSRPHLLPTLIHMLHGHISNAAKGQCADLTNEKSRSLSIEQYERLAALKSGSLIALPIELALAVSGDLQAIPLARCAAESFAIGYQIFDDLNDVDIDLARRSVQPAINAVAIMKANNTDEDAVFMARKLATTHLTAAAKTSQSLPHQCGEVLRRLALDLSARIHSVSA